MMRGINHQNIFFKTKIINDSPAPVYKGVEAIECLHILREVMQNGNMGHHDER